MRLEVKGLMGAPMEKMDIEMQDKKVDVKEIMRRIRENIKKRRKEQKVVDVGKLERKIDPEKPHYNIRQELDFINAGWDIENKTYRIYSHKKFLGPFLIKGRELVHGEIRRYVDSVFWKQTEFNAHAARILNHFSEEIPEIKGQLSEQKIHLASLLQSVPQIKEQLNENLDLDYLKFEKKFRGTEEDIKNGQRNYLKYFKSKKNVLDIGCGRGEFLELLKEHGIKAKGIDIDKKMVDYCKKKGLDVVLSDATDHLESLPNNTLDGIFIAQVIEHFKPKKITEIINLAYKKLKRDSYLVIETVNPTSFISLSSFTIDPTHVNPLHPSLMEFLYLSAGFKEVELRFLSPIPEDSKLQKIQVDKKLNGLNTEFINTYNKNIEKLNSIIYGYQDYAVIGKK